jgi:hypothetical protein
MDYTDTDYYTAAIERLQDFKHLSKEQDRIIFTVYSAGVAIECMLRAYILKYNPMFDSKHDLENLLIDSKLTTLFDEGNKKEQKEREAIIVAIKQAKKVWNNNLRYYSEKRLKRQFGHEMANTKHKDINKYFFYKCSELFNATHLITEIGIAKWNYLKK